MGGNLDELRVGAVQMFTDHGEGRALTSAARRTEFAMATADAGIDGDPFAGLEPAYIGTNLMNDSRRIASRNLG